MIYKCLNELSPQYLSNMLSKYAPLRQLRSSEDTTILSKPVKKYKNYGERSFAYLGPLFWNELPRDIRELRSIELFKNRLKSHYFYT